MQHLAFDRLSRFLVASGFLLLVSGLLVAFTKAQRSNLTAGFTFWLCLIGTLAFLVLDCWVGHRELGIRVIGMIFQLAGLAVAVYAIHDLRARLDQPGLISVLAQAAEGPLMIQHPPVTGVGAATASSGTVEAFGTLTTHPKSLSTEARFEALENQVAKLEALQASETAALRRTVRDNERMESGHYRQLEAAVKALKKLVVDLETGGFVLASFGVVWLVIGTVLTSLPDKVSSLVAYVFR